MNLNELLKIFDAELKKIRGYSQELLLRLYEERKYYKNEIKNNDYSDDDIWAIIKGCFNNTELAFLHFYLKYSCKFGHLNFCSFVIKLMKDTSIYIYDDFIRVYISCDDLKYYNKYGKRGPNDMTAKFIDFCNGLNEFKKSHQAELLNKEPIDIYNYDFCDETTSILLSSDSETDEDDEPDEPEEPVE